MKLLKFYASWCGPCKALTKELQENPVNAEVVSIDVDEEDDLVTLLNIKNVPVLVLYDGDKIIHKWFGFTKSSVINDFIKDYESNSSTGNSLEQST